MKTIKQYSKVCESCHANGYILETGASSTSCTKVCPACNGSGIITVTETIIDETGYAGIASFTIPKTDETEQPDKG